MKLKNHTHKWNKKFTQLKHWIPKSLKKNDEKAIDQKLYL